MNEPILAPLGQPATNKKRSIGKIIAYIVVVLVLLFALVQYFNAAKYQALVQVIKEDRVGVNPTGERLDFGDLPRNKDAVRTVTLEDKSPYKAKSYIMIWKYGDIAQLMKVDYNNFTLNPGETKKIEFSVHIPDSADYRYYRGHVIIFQLPKFW